jgi:hypothetical protein
MIIVHTLCFAKNAFHECSDCPQSHAVLLVVLSASKCEQSLEKTPYLNKVFLKRQS